MCHTNGTQIHNFKKEQTRNKHKNQCRPNEFSESNLLTSHKRRVKSQVASHSGSVSTPRVRINVATYCTYREKKQRKVTVVGINIDKYAGEHT